MGPILNSREESTLVQGMRPCRGLGPLTIGIDAGPLLGQGGISGYVRPLVHALLKIDMSSRYRLCLRKSWVTESAVSTLETLAPIDTCYVPDRLLSWWWKHVGTPFPMGGDSWKRMDLFLATCLMAPVLAGGKVVSVIYDLIPLRLPHLFPNHKNFRDQLEQVVARSQKLITISLQTKWDLMEILGVDEDKINVIVPGREDIFRPATEREVQNLRQRHGIKGRYILYVGSTGPHKNVETLLRAYQEACMNGEFSLSLVMVIRGGISSTVERLLESLDNNSEVYCLRDVPRQDLPILYTGSQFFVWPSRYEGFGLPVLEAMACGKSVMLGKEGASHEIIGSAGYFVDIEDPIEMASAMCALAQDETLQAKLGSWGASRATTFSWSESAELLKKVLHGMVEI